VTGAPTGAVAPTDLIDGCLAAQATLLDALAGLQDDTARQPSLLPGWTVGHVLTHIARNADSVVWRLEGAAAGELRDQYPGGLTQRAGDIDDGAGRPAVELVLDVQRTSDAVARIMADLRPAAWDAPSRTSKGAVETSRDAALSRWREVVVHHGDLGLGPVPLPPALVEVWLPRELPRLAERGDPADILSWIIGRGEPPILSPW
jgi:maleylpyruvate isomerase